ncbi:MAG: redox-regulated ATPase YchF [Patescibacteria group bacterium]|nr:redox-regulated ATPase YchF [Patescibacteria group bacterium]
MKIGIVGLPNVGKSTLFKALTNIQVDINNYPFCTIEPNIGVVEVPDQRVTALAKLSNSKQKLFATVEFVDIAGLVKGAAEGQGLGNKFLHNIREVDAIAHVVRMFEDKNIVHVHDVIDPKEDIEIVNTELILADIETVEKRLTRLDKEARTNDKEKIKQREITLKLKEILAQNNFNEVRKFIKSIGKDFDYIYDLHLLLFKPILCVFNTNNPEKIKEEFKRYGMETYIRMYRQTYVPLAIKIEEELLELSDKDKAELKLKSELSELIKKSYDMLGLMTFLTTGEKESRAWTIPKGSTAPRAARAIHGDFEEKFIRAEVINYDNLIKIKPEQKTCPNLMKQARESGLVRTEGKDYIVQDGDVIEFLI